MTGAVPSAHPLGAALRDVRGRAKISQREVSRRMGVHHTTVGRWEDGTLTPDTDQVGDYLDAVGIGGDERVRILALVTTGDETNWLITGPSGVRPQLAVVMEYERTAVRITEWSPLVIPGLLQIEDYAAAIVSRSSASIPPDEVRGRVMVRMARQSALTRVDPVELQAVVGFPAVYSRLGGPRVMAAQLRHLTGMGERGNVTVQAYDPSSAEEWTPAHAGQFIVYEFAELNPVVYLEHHRSGAFLTDAQDVAAYQAAAETIRRVAMSPEATAELIASVIPNMETTI